MARALAIGIGHGELAQAIERQISRRTSGRGGRLGVEVFDGRIVVHGYTFKYYTMQLVLEAVRDVVGRESPRRIDLDIEVLPASSRENSLGYCPA